MRPSVLTTSGTSVSSVCPMDYVQTPFDASVQVKASGTVTYTIQSTNDDVWSSTFSATTATWTDSTTYTGSTYVTYSNPVRALRINQSAGEGNTTGTVLQGIGC